MRGKQNDVQRAHGEKKCRASGAHRPEAPGSSSLFVGRGLGAPPGPEALESRARVGAWARRQSPCQVESPFVLEVSIASGWGRAWCACAGACGSWPSPKEKASKSKGPHGPRSNHVGECFMSDVYLGFEVGRERRGARVGGQCAICRLVDASTRLCDVAISSTLLS